MYIQKSKSKLIIVKPGLRIPHIITTRALEVSLSLRAVTLNNDPLLAIEDTAYEGSCIACINDLRSPKLSVLMKPVFIESRLAPDDVEEGEGAKGLVCSTGDGRDVDDEDTLELPEARFRRGISVTALDIIPHEGGIALKGFATMVAELAENGVAFADPEPSPLGDRRWHVEENQVFAHSKLSRNALHNAALQQSKLGRFGQVELTARLENVSWTSPSDIENVSADDGRRRRDEGVMSRMP